MSYNNSVCARANKITVEFALILFSVQNYESPRLSRNDLVKHRVPGGCCVVVRDRIIPKCSLHYYFDPQLLEFGPCYMQIHASDIYQLDSVKVSVLGVTNANCPPSST